MDRFDKFLGLMIVAGLVLVFVGTCMGIPKNSDPPLPPLPQIIYLQPFIIDHYDTTIVEITRDRICEPSPRYSPDLKCLDENGNVVLP